MSHLTPRPSRRRSTLPALLLGVLATSYAATAAPPSVDIAIEGTPRRTVLRYVLPDHRSHPLEIGGEAYEAIALPGEAVTMERGAPSLPVVCRSVMVPDDAAMAVTVRDARFRDIPAKIVPSKGSLPRSVDPSEIPYRFGPAYAEDAFWPPEVAVLSDPYILRDRRGVVVELHPFQYNPVAGVLRVYSEVTLEIAAVGPGVTNVLSRRRRPEATSAAFEQIYRHQFLNHPAAGRYDPLDEAGELLVICHDPWLPYMQPYVAHKQAAGITTTIVPASAVGSDPEEIKAFVQAAYDTTDLAFLLIVGDAEDVSPGWLSLGEGLAACDPEYALLAGDDTYPDVIVGRFSAETAGDVLTLIERVITYERAPAVDQDWFRRGIGIGSEGGPGDDGEMDYEHILIIRDWLLAYGYTHVDAFEDPLAIDVDEVRAALDAGRGIFNFCGHGGSGGWGAGSFGFGLSDVDSMVNVNKLPFIVSVACSTGDFAGKTCLGERFLLATHNGEPTGAIGFYGSTVSQYWNEPMEAQDEFNLMYVAEQYVSYGALCYAGSCSMMDAYGAGGVDMFMTWHIFGDPTLRVVGALPAPTGLEVLPFASLVSGGPDGGPFAPAEITYALTNNSGSPLEWMAGADAPWIDLGAAGGTLAPGTAIDVTVSLNDLADGFEDGTYVATVTLEDLTNGWATERTVILNVGAPVPIHVFGLDEDPGWSVEGEWAFGQPTGQGGDEYGNPDPTGGATGPAVYGVNLNGDYSIEPGGPFALTTAAIDCLDLEQTTLRFQRWLNTDFRPYVMADIEVSDDGSSWTPVWSNPGSEIVDGAWAEYTYDISHVADLSSTVYVRWTYEKGAPAYPYSGWNIDDVAIWGNDVEPTGMQVRPHEDLHASGPLGGPFAPESIEYALTNHTDELIGFAVQTDASWIDISQTHGTIPPAGKVKVAVSISDGANDLPNGSYVALVTITNLSTHEGDTERTVILDIDEPGPIYTVDLDADPGWSVEGEWAFGQPTGQGGDQHGHPDPTAGATGPNVYGVNLHGDYSIDPGGPYRLTTGAFDCTALSDVQLRFMRWLNSDYQPYVTATIEVSSDGAVWTPIWDNGESEIAESAWSEQVYDISSVADGEPTVYLRWGYQVEPAAYPYSGWNIDDIEIRGIASCPGDIVADGVVDVNDLLALLAAWGACPDCAADVDGDGVVDVNDLLSLLAAWGACG